MSPTQSADYAEHLRLQDAAVQAFVDVLHRERDILAVQPISMAALSDVTEAKTAHANRLENLESQRRIMADAERSQAPYLDDADIAERLGCRDHWACLTGHIVEARTQNDINGLAIQTRLDYTNRALGVLRKNAAKSLYAADGQRRPSSQGRLRGGA